MVLSLLAIAAGLALLIWSADRFVEGSAAVASHLGAPPLLVGMVIVGFGTSAPEMVVSAIASFNGSPGLALGNAFGSNIANTGLILGITALVSPIIVRSGIIYRELPVLIAVSLGMGILLFDKDISRMDALILLSGFTLLLGWTIYTALANKDDVAAVEMASELDAHSMPIGRASLWIFIGLAVLIGSSRLLVWGAVDIAQNLGLSDLVIGLTIVAIGTSLPELASSIVAVRKGEDDLAIGNIIGSNMFNLLAVVGIAGAIQPVSGLSSSLFTRDWLTMMLMLLLLLLMVFRTRGAGRISRWGGALLVSSYAAYTGVLLVTL